MTSDEQDAADLIARTRAGDQAAATVLFDRFSRRLIALAGTRLDRLVRARVDPEDVVLSAYGSFFGRLADGQFALAEWGEVWGLLVRITLRKCGHKLEDARAQCRDAARERSLSPPTGEDSSAGWEPIARGPTPSEVAILAETVEALVAGFDLIEREIVEQRLQGYSEREISEAVGRSERTVRRVLERLRRRVERMHTDEG
jgi:RNA polymerase sigma-70 factor (ECF subfamily)